MRGKYLFLVIGLIFFYLFLFRLPSRVQAQTCNATNNAYCYDVPCSQDGLCAKSFSGCSNYGMYCCGDPYCSNTICGCTSLGCTGGVAKSCCSPACPAGSTCSPSTTGGSCVYPTNTTAPQVGGICCPIDPNNVGQINTCTGADKPSCQINSLSCNWYNSANSCPGVPTSTPTPTPATGPGICCPKDPNNAGQVNTCTGASGIACQTNSSSCDWHGYQSSCPSAQATNTPAPTSPPGPPSATCNSTTNVNKYYCSGNMEYQCDGTTWRSTRQCIYNCGTTSYCTSTGVNGQCKSACGIPYCETHCSELCGTDSYMVYCYTDQSKANMIPAPPDNPSCVYIDGYNTCIIGGNVCTPLWDTCGGTINCDAFYPGQGLVSHVDSCSGMACGLPCTGPTSPPVLPLNTSTPTPLPAVVQARAVNMTTIPQTCAEIVSSINWRDATVFDLASAGVSQGVKTQAAGGFVTWNPPAPATYNLSVTNDTNSTLRSCLQTTSGGSSFGPLSVNLIPGDTATFNIAFGPAGGWYQSQGGDVYAASQIKSLIPATAATTVSRLFNLDGLPVTISFPGVVTYGSASLNAYDFNPSLSDSGSAYVSSKNWLANEVFPTRNFYNFYFSKLGSPTTIDYDHPADPITKPAFNLTEGSPNLFVVSGDMTTSVAPWSIADGESYIFLVNGNLTINGNINLVGSGFIAFIVNGNIIVSPGVGTVYNSTTAQIEGVYLANGTFITGNSGVAASEKLVAKGIFVANNFTFERDLAPDNQNNNYPAELFIYNPRLLLEIPDVMQDNPIIWQEVAP